MVVVMKTTAKSTSHRFKGRPFIIFQSSHQRFFPKQNLNLIWGFLLRKTSEEFGQNPKRFQPDVLYSTKGAILICLLTPGFPTSKDIWFLMPPVRPPSHLLERLSHAAIFGPSCHVVQSMVQSKESCGWLFPHDLQHLIGPQQYGKNMHQTSVSKNAGWDSIFAESCRTSNENKGDGRNSTVHLGWCMSLAPVWEDHPPFLLNRESREISQSPQRRETSHLRPVSCLSLVHKPI